MVGRVYDSGQVHRNSLNSLTGNKGIHETQLRKPARLKPGHLQGPRGKNQNRRGWRWQIAAEVFVGARSGDAPARGAVEHADLHEIGLIHFFRWRLLLR